NVMSAHYIELAPSALTALGAGDILYETPSSTAGGTSAIDFAQEPLTEDGGIVYKTPIKNVTPGSYQYLRVSLAYQNYDVKMLIDTTIAGITINQEFPCTIASFVGFNTYIPDFKIKTSIISVNGNRLQGFWGFESPINYFGFNYDVVDTGQAPANATTVVNPISATSPIPAGSCVATGAFNNNTAQPLHITGTETSDVVVTISLSTNHSFEWVEVNPDGKWEPLKGEYIVDMGIRGLMPTVQY
ncbi:MAG TPA: hypothetical protein VG603_02645, partial [Chitinophagales bacterium]|nr:hypothetical protein [Chitinophagales bacterium]